MANLSNINISITAQDNTGPGVSSALRNLSSLGGAFGSIGKIGAGVFTGILGANVFSGIARGIGSVVSSAFGLNNTLASTRMAGESMVNTIADSEPIGTAAFGGLSRAASQFERTMREIRERESDGLASYAEKIDDIKTRILESEQEVARAKEDRLAREKEQLDDLASNYEKTIQRINRSIEDENLSHEERMYDLNNQRADKLENLEEARENKVESINDKIAELEQDRLTAMTQAEVIAIDTKIDKLQEELAEFIAKNDAEINKTVERSDHEISVTQQKHDRKIELLNQELVQEQTEYDKRKARIQKDAAEDVAKAEETSKKKVENLQKQLAKEEEEHKRFLRDIQEAYADAKEKMDLSGAGGGGGTGTKRVNFQFDFAEAFREMKKTPGEIDKFLGEVQTKYEDIAIKSPFNIGEISEFGKSMIRFTGGSADNMENMVNMAQSLAAFDPIQGMRGATTALVELFGSGNITPLAQRFEIPKESLAGLSEAKNATEFIELLNQALEKNGINMGLVDAKIQTLSGAWQNAAESFGLLMGRITQPVWQVLTDALVDVNKWINANKESIDLWMESAQNLVGSGVGVLIENFKIFGQILSDFWSKNGQQITDWFKSLWDNITLLVTPALQLLQTIWLTVQQSLEETVIPGMTRIFDTLRRFWEEIAPEIKKTLEFIKKWWTEHNTEIIAYLKIAWAIIEATIRFVIDTIKAIIKVGLALIRGDWQGVWDAIKTYVIDIWNNLKDAASNVASGLATIWRKSFNDVIDSVNGMLDGIKKLSEVKINGKVIFGGISVPHIPRLATGGIVTGPTLALIGESGPEAVVPLNRARGGLAGVNIYISGNEIMGDESIHRFARMIGDDLVSELSLQGPYV